MKGYEDLVKTLKNIQATNGMDVSNEAAIEYQDMIGHSSEEQLEELANGTYKEAFYKVYGVAYGTIEAIKFYCKHGQKIREMLETNADQAAEIDKLNFLLEAEKDKRRKIDDERHENLTGWNQALDEIDQKDYKIQQLEYEIMNLKAKLYDLTQATA